jgi:7-cyano-7-deazaguanine synthase
MINSMLHYVNNEVPKESKFSNGELMVTKQKPSTLILLSGGIDSTACIRYYLELNFNVTGLFIDYGQRSRNLERNSAIHVANHYNVTLDDISLSNKNDFAPGEIRGRNAFFLMTALLVYPKFKGIISMGIHAGNPYYDCSQRFIKDITTLLDAYSSGEVRFDAPFITWDKRAIYDYCIKEDVPIHLTYSCQNGSLPPCGQCDSCKDRKVLYACRKI